MRTMPAATAAETTAYFKGLEKQYGLKQKFELGSGAFVSPNGVVVTRNTRDFGRVPGLPIEDWSK